MGKVDVRVVACKNLYNQETFGKSDPYVVVSCEGKKYKTTTKRNDLNPTWNEKFSFMLADPQTSQLEFKVMDDNFTSDTPMGKYNFSLAGLVKGKVQDSWHILNDAKSGEIHLRVMAVDFGQDAPPPQPSAPPMQGAPAGGGYPQQPGYPPQQGGYPPQQKGPGQGQPPPGYYPPQQGAPPPQPGYPPQQGGYPPPQQGYPPQQGGYPPPPQQGGYPPQQGGYPPQQGGYPPQGGPPPPPPSGRNFSNDDITGQQLNGSNIHTCDITNCTLWNCTINKADFKGTNTLYNCNVREIDVYGHTTVSGGTFEWGEVKPGGQLVNSGGCSIKDIDNYHGY